MAYEGGVDQQFICCSQCHGLFTRRKSLLQHKTYCNGDPASSKCEFIAIPVASAIKECQDDKQAHGTQAGAEHVPTAPKDPKEENKIENRVGLYSRSLGRPRKTPHLTASGQNSEPELISEVVVVQEAVSVEENALNVTKHKKRGRPRKRPLPSSEPTGQESDAVVIIEPQPRECDDNADTNAEKEETHVIIIEPITTSKNKGRKLKTPNEMYSKSVKPNILQSVRPQKQVSENESQNMVLTADKCITKTDEKNSEMECSAGTKKDTEDEELVNDQAEVQESNLDQGDAGLEEDSHTTSIRPMFGKSGYIKKRDINKIMKCDLCDYTTKLPGMFSRHQTSHNDGSEFTCEVCHKTFAHRRLYKTHMLVHTRVQCPFCHKSYGRPNDRDRHIKNVHYAYKLVYKCDQCDFSSQYQSNLKEHIRKHTGERLACSYENCQFTTLYLRALKQHISSVHATSRNFGCSICNYKAATKLQLSKHMVSHSTLRTKTCPLCEYVGKTASSLHSHMLTHKDKKYFCDQCTYSTNRGSAFKTHMLYHLGVKPWMCATCKYEAITKEKVVRHIVSKHNGKADMVKQEVTLKLDLEAYIKKPDNEETIMAVDTGECMVETESEVNENSEKQIYRCALCPFFSSKLADVEAHLNEHPNMEGEETVVVEEAVLDGMELQEASQAELGEMVYILSQERPAQQVIVEHVHDLQLDESEVAQSILDLQQVAHEETA